MYASTKNLPLPESILACLLAAASSILSLGMPLATALAIPPRSSIYTLSQHTHNIWYVRTYIAQRPQLQMYVTNVTRLYIAHMYLLYMYMKLYMYLFYNGQSCFIHLVSEAFHHVRPSPRICHLHMHTSTHDTSTSLRKNEHTRNIYYLTH